MPDKRHNTILRRIAAYFIDMLVLSPALAAALMTYKKWYGTWAGVLFGLGMMTLGSGYFIAMNVRYGATVGKKAVRCRVVDARTLGPVTLGMAARREALPIFFGMLGIMAHDPVHALPVTLVSQITPITRWWFFLDDPLVLFNGRRRAVHDYLAGTVVIWREGTKDLEAT